MAAISNTYSAPEVQDEDGTLASARKHLEDQGWCVLPGILTPERSQEILDRVWRAAEESERRGTATFMPRLDPNASNVRVFYLLELDVMFRELIQHPLAVQMVQSLLGPEFLISNFTANIARPGSKSMGLHSDQSLVVSDPWNQPWALNVIWCLTDVYFENGATLYIPESHRWRYKSEVPDNANEMLRPFVAKAGSFVVMDGRLWHTSGANITRDQDRALLFAYYTVPFIRQQVNWTAALSGETKKTMTPELFEWMGLGISANQGKVSDLRYLENQFPKEKGKI